MKPIKHAAVKQLPRIKLQLELHLDVAMYVPDSERYFYTSLTRRACSSLHTFMGKKRPSQSPCRQIHHTLKYFGQFSAYHNSQLKPTVHMMTSPNMQ